MHKILRKLNKQPLVHLTEVNLGGCMIRFSIHVPNKLAAECVCHESDFLLN